MVKIYSGIRRLLLYILALALVPMVACAEDRVVIPGVDGNALDLAIHLPPDFDPSRSYSVLVGPGDYYWQDRPSQPGWILALGEAFFGPDRLENSKRALDWLEKSYRVEGGGFHIAGWSANSAGVFEIVMAYPERFLSATGVAGMPGRGAEENLARLEGVRVQFIVGEHDTYWRQGSERWFEKMQELGIEASLEIIPGGEHVMPEIANEPMFERMNRLVAEIEATR